MRCREKKRTPFLVPRTSTLINVLSDVTFRIHACLFLLHWKLFPPTCGSCEFSHVFEESRASGAPGTQQSLTEPLMWQMVPEGLEESSPGMLPMDRFCACHSGPWTSRSMVLIFFFLNYLTENIPLTDYESLKTCLSTGIPLKGAFCFLQKISLQRSHQLWTQEPLSPFKLKEKSRCAVAMNMLAF